MPPCFLKWPWQKVVDKYNMDILTTLTLQTKFLDSITPYAFVTPWFCCSVISSNDKSLDLLLIIVISILI